MNLKKMNELLSSLRKEASNENTSPKRLAELATYCDWGVRAKVARNSRTPVTVLEKLATDSHKSVLRSLARNLHTTISINKD